MSTTLSYILATRNKLPYLRLCVEDLIKHKKDDEEIIIVDGDSTDGSAEYLRDLHGRGLIDQFISEKDYGEAHADNKALLMASGELIKIITDDDVFHYPGMARCKEFMLAHPEIDVLSTDGVKTRKAGSRYPMGMLSYRTNFGEWKRRGKPFDSCGLGLMIRRSSLPLLGLFHTGFVRMDAEYTLRMSAGKANVAWYALECYARILNPSSNTTTQSDRYYRDTENLEALYFGKHPSPGSAWTRALKKWLRPYIKRTQPDEQAMTIEEWERMYEDAKKWLDANASENRGEFLWRT